MGKSLKDRLLDEIKRRGVKIPAVSKQTGIPKDRIYAWYRDNTNPKSGDQIILNSWLKGESSTNSEEDDISGMPGSQEGQNKGRQENGTSKTQSHQADLMTLYVDSLKEQKRILEEHNEFLRRNFEVSLNAISEGQKIMAEGIHGNLNHIRALTWYQAWMQAGRNDEGAEQDLTKIHSKAAEYAAVTPKRDNHDKRHTGIQEPGP